MRINLKTLQYSLYIVTAVLVTDPAWALPTPEPASGGKFFRSKGTRSSAEYLERLESYVPDHHYGKGINLDELVTLNPSIEYAREWDNNIFLTEGARKEDWINRLDWGVDAEMPIDAGKHTLVGGLHSESEWFNRFDGQNHTDWLFEGGGRFNFNPFSLEIMETFERTVSRAGTEFQSRIDRKENTLRGLLEVPFAQFFSEVEVIDYDLNFRDSALGANDRHEFSVFPRLGVDIGDRTQGLLEYGLDTIQYDHNEDRDGLVNQAQGGVRGFLGGGDLITYQLWAGVQFRNYEQDVVKDYTGFIARGEIRYDPTENTQFMLHLTRYPVESTATGQSYYVQNALTLHWRQRIYDRLFVHTLGNITYNRYSRERKDFRWEPAIRLEYVLPRDIVAIFGEYRFTQRESNQDDADYHRQIASFGIRAEI